MVKELVKEMKKKKGSTFGGDYDISLMNMK
jgi:hypothetical protein